MDAKYTITGIIAVALIVALAATLYFSATW